MCSGQMSLFRQHAAPCTFPAEESWVILSPIEASIKRKIEAVGTPLSEWDISINYGIKTGCNEAFIISTARRDEILAARRDEILAACRDEDERRRTAELIRPILRGRDIKRYGYEWAELWLIATFPSRHYDIEQYPAVRDYLLSFGREKLEQTGATYIRDGQEFKARKKTNNQWFETQDSISYWEDFDKPKIVWGEISDRSKFAFEEEGKYIPEATTFFMTGKDLPYLFCILNSPLSEWLFSKVGTTTGVGTVRWKKYTILSLLVPNIKDELRSQFSELVNLLMKGRLSLDEFSAKANRTLNELIGLTEEEIAYVENFYPSL